MATTGKDCAWSCARTAAWGGSLALSAFLLAVAAGASTGFWLACISLLPLFRAIRVLTPARATLAGAGWGVCVYICGVAGAVPALAPTPLSFALLTMVPAAYAGLGALATRAIGFDPLVLGLGWVLVELALKPLGLHQGLLAATQGNGILMDWVGRPLGYVFIGLLVACTNASVLTVVCGIRWRFPRSTSLAGLANTETCPPSHVPVRIRCWACHQAQPRAPPATATR